MDIIVKGRHTQVGDRFREHVMTKLGKVEKFDHKVIRMDVEVSKENTKGGDSERVELTIVSKGPAIRAEAAASDRFAALDMALAKLDARLRKLAGRRKMLHSGHAPARLNAVAATLAPDGSYLADHQASQNGNHWSGGAGNLDATGNLEDGYAPPDVPRQSADGDIVKIDGDGDCPVVVREKAHKSDPMTIDDALFEMELVGHDFFLFRDKESGKPSVVYRRRGWNYGIIRLIEE